MAPRRRQSNRETEFDGRADAGAAQTEGKKASSIKKKDFLLIKGYPCECKEINTSKTGKHGGAKCHIIGMDIFTNKKHEFIVGSTVDVKVPSVKKREMPITYYDAEDRRITGLNNEGELEQFMVENDEVLRKINDLDFEEDSFKMNVMECLGKQLVINVMKDSSSY